MSWTTKNRKVGGPTSGHLVQTPARRRRERIKRKREDERWKRRNGPVIVRTDETTTARAK